MAHLRTTQAIDKANAIVADCISRFNVRQNHLTSLGVTWHGPCSRVDIGNTTHLALQSLLVGKARFGSQPIFAVNRVHAGTSMNMAIFQLTRSSY
jgi:hypothetical protein